MKPQLSTCPEDLAEDHTVLEELSAVGSDMSVLIATQHFHATASKMVSQAVRSSYWPPGASG